jgi:hypothetical protein
MKYFSRLTLGQITHYYSRNKNKLAIPISAKVLKNGGTYTVTALGHQNQADHRQPEKLQRPLEDPDSHSS